MIDFLIPTDPEDSLTLANSVRRFASKELPEVRTFRRKDFDAMAKLGLSAIGIDENYGGIPLDPLASSAVLFEIAKVNLGPAVYLSVHQMVARLINANASNEFHKQTLAALASGSSLGAFCLTEAGAGSDASALQLKAKATAGGFELSGEKIYISSAPHADIFLVFARTSEDQKKGISCFVVSSDTEGITVGPAEKKMGCEASPIASVRFDKCEIPKDALLGTIGAGYKIALSGLNKGRISIAACACGISAAAIEKAQAHLLSRSQFGQQLSEFQGLQFMIADMVIAHRAAVLLTRDAITQLLHAPSENSPASMAKCFATDTAMKNSTDAVQLLGGAGYLSEYGVEQLMRDAKMLQIVEGTNQIQRLVIARNLL